MNDIKWTLLNYASGVAGRDLGTGQGPNAVLAQVDFHKIADKLSPPEWFKPTADIMGPAALPVVIDICQQMAQRTRQLTKQHQRFVTLGGDHTCALGSWVGANSTLAPLGLIWVDAHMDSHTTETSHTGNLHGMPLAALLGHGTPELTQLIPEQKKLLPEHVCLIGIRSFEPEEQDLLEQLGVRIYYMEEVKQRGLNVIMAEAIERVNQNTTGFGISIDLDSIDPNDAPGVSVPEKDGIHAEDLLESLTLLHGDERLKGIEIAEYDPVLDINNQTAKLAIQLLERIL